MKKYDEKKICFIVCYQENHELDECLLYLNMLEVPEGYETELLTVYQEESVAAGYQEAMDYSDARYKVYLDTKTYIINRQFIYDFLEVFKSDDRIAMQGVMGCERLSKDGVIWHSLRRGNVYRGYEIDDSKDITIEEEHMVEVEAVEHYVMITAEDIPWRTDLFESAEFAAISKALEFRRRGYKVVVPPQKKPWTIYQEPVHYLTDCETERQRLLEEYQEIRAGQDDLRILVLKSDAIFMIGLATGFVELGHQVTTLGTKVSVTDNSGQVQGNMELLLEEGHYDLVVTCDYAVPVAEACQRVGVRYLAWIFDSPQIHTYHKSAKNEYTHISVFERPQYERMKKTGVKHLYYHPLATDVDLLGSAVIDEQDEKNYAADISFVGRLYEEKALGRTLTGAPEEIKDDVRQAIAAPGCIWDGTPRLFGNISQSTLQYILDHGVRSEWVEYGEDQDRYYFAEALLLGNKANQTERIAVLNRLAEKYNVRLYTLRDQNFEALRNVEICPEILYDTEAPKVFYLSKINLNISSRSITDGIPQRIWDVLACGGFMLTNYQPEIEEYLQIGKDLEVFHDLDELMDKADYYLTHEDERLKIALNGYQTVRDHHRYKHRLEPLLKEIFGGSRQGK